MDYNEEENVCYPPPKPRDMNRINEKRKEFSQGNNQSNQRYHEEEVEERFGKYKPGIVRSEPGILSQIASCYNL